MMFRIGEGKQKFFENILKFCKYLSEKTSTSCLLTEIFLFVTLKTPIFF